jgi:hypothetical protein
MFGGKVFCSFFLLYFIPLFAYFKVGFSPEDNSQKIENQTDNKDVVTNVANF